MSVLSEPGLLVWLLLYSQGKKRGIRRDSESGMTIDLLDPAASIEEMEGSAVLALLPRI